MGATSGGRGHAGAERALGGGRRRVQRLLASMFASFPSYLYLRETSAVSGYFCPGDPSAGDGEEGALADVALVLGGGGRVRPQGP